MRLFLLPVSTRRTLLYAQRLGVTTTDSQARYIDKGAAWAAKTWANWEKKESGWQKKVVVYGNHAFRRIAFEEWGLKSVPPLSARRRDEELKGPGKVDLVFPSSLIPAEKAESIIQRLSTERQALHRQRLIWCVVGMPITIPFALVPVIPNLPFFYLVYRAWSHWRAIAGGKHVQWLIANKLLTPSPSKTLDRLYEHVPAAELSGVEQPLLTQDQIHNYSQTLEMPELETELDRAIWQIEQAREKQIGSQEKAESKSREGETEKVQTQSTKSDSEKGQ